MNLREAPRPKLGVGRTKARKYSEVGRVGELAVKDTHKREIQVRKVSSSQNSHVGRDGSTRKQ